MPVTDRCTRSTWCGRLLQLGLQLSLGYRHITTMTMMMTTPGLDMERATAAAERRSYLLPDCRQAGCACPLTLLMPSQPCKVVVVASLACLLSRQLGVVASCMGALHTAQVLTGVLTVLHSVGWGLHRETQLELALLYYFASAYEDAWEELRMMLDGDENACADAQVTVFRQKLALLRSLDSPLTVGQGSS